MALTYPRPRPLRIRRLLVAASLLALALGGAGCDFFGFGSGTGGPKMRVDPNNVQESARLAYFEGMKDLVSGNYTAAVAQFNVVARSPKYVHYAALARLRIGDALFLQERYKEAIQTYRAFMGQYESDPNLPYARYRIASCYVEQMPDEWFLSVPSEEIDQQTTREAVRELTEFLNLFPTSRFAGDGRRMLVEARQMLFEHELFVAEYYEDRDLWRAVAWRLDEAIRDFRDLALTPEIVLRMSDAYAEAGDVGDAIRGLGLYLDSFPDDPQRGQVEARLAELQAQLGPAS